MDSERSNSGGPSHSPIQPLDAGEGRFDRFASMVRSPASLTLLARAVGILVGGFLAWVVLAGAFSVLPFWTLILATVALGTFVFVKSHKLQERQWWIDQGLCAGCGYDLRRLPTSVCPECGRDAAPDEPTWRRLRRQHEAMYGPDAGRAEAGSGGGKLSEAEVRRLLAAAADKATDATG